MIGSVHKFEYASKFLLVLQEILILSDLFKFGILYCKIGQISEEEMYNNNNPSIHFNKFLELMGKRVKLKDRKEWSGLLDNTEDKDGESSIYTTYKEKYQIMFHVSTLIPYSHDDKQQILRKRHIGNDVVVIIYQENDDEEIKDLPFSAGAINSKFNHVYIIVRRISPNDADSPIYRVGVTRKKGVMSILPSIPKGRIFQHDSVFREWLLLKCINGERSSQFADGFAYPRLKARESLLQSIFTHLQAASSTQEEV